MKTQPLLLIGKELNDIVSIGVYEDSQKNEHTGYLCIFKEFITGLLPAQDLVEQEHHVSSVEGRNRQHVDNGQDDRQESGQIPESIPIPYAREYLSNGDKPAHFLICFCFRRKNQTQLLEVFLKSLHSFGNASRNGSYEIVTFLLQLEVFVHVARVKADMTFGCGGKLNGFGLAPFPFHNHGDLLTFFIGQHFF